MNLPLQIEIPFLDHVYLGVKVADYIWFASLIVGTMLLKKPITNLLMRISSRLATQYSYSRHKNVIGAILFKPLERLLITVLLFLATEHISGLLDQVTFHRKAGKSQIQVNLGDVTDHIFLLLFIIYLTQVITHFIDFVYYMRIGKADTEKDRSRQQLLPLLKEMSKLITWTLAIFSILGSVFHVNIPALITGLGIGGVAIALAGKETVENFFAAFTILSDKPFQTGETIRLGDIEGVVERIGFRSTRLRNRDGSAYIIPNQNLVSQNLINLSAREKWKVNLIVNIKYGMSHNDLQQLITKIKDALKATPPIIDPVNVAIEGFDKETFQLIISYSLPQPMPDELDVNSFKRAVNVKVFEIITANATLGTPVGTS